MALSELQHQWLALRMIPADTLTPAQRRWLARLDYRLGELTTALAAEPLPSAQGLFASTTAIVEPTQYPVLRELGSELREQLTEALLRQHVIVDAAPYLDMIRYRVNMSRQLREVGDGLASLLRGAGFTTYEHQLLAAELLGAYNSAALASVDPHPQVFQSIRDALHMPPREALNSYAQQEYEGHPAANGVHGAVTFAIEMISFYRMNNDNHRQLYQALRALHQQPIGQATTSFVELLTLYLSLADPTYRIVDLQTAHQFVRGTL